MRDHSSDSRKPLQPRLDAREASSSYLSTAVEPS
jgi:hypothetical protein